ncbi:AbiV family abortive infection protein [Chryseobacterium sp. NKUCC03_KSP]|uniref:AbiV family abortive infection protein n=1 Tax=Chryseobacterium sp. NKUCC03_KSP TaxID=2842125 RepID=UPI001C5B54AF|nr:AbiV family abortive infection protein [Chryseobacterium sp. NKUCC03_KSP]MBW3522879.1 AbiV family abortive infection protein [Chryseobacterium sp. NKUCC03_KSP]
MHLKKETLEKAVINALNNASELFEEAGLLEKNKKFARAFTLFHLSIEEVGKVFIIFKYLLQNNYSSDEMKKFDKEFRNHKIKINASTKIDVLLACLEESSTLSPELIEKVTYSKEKINNLNQLKNLSLYSFINEDLSFKPTDIIRKEDVEEIHLIAQYRIEGTQVLSDDFLKNIDRNVKLIDNLKYRK